MNRRSFLGGIAALCVSPTLPAAELGTLTMCSGPLAGSAYALQAGACALTEAVESLRTSFYFDYVEGGDWPHTLYLGDRA